jgi:BirA family biotin operon repressor/biotin-[acetyl-CoA-carboxylase] ligase
MDTAGIYRALAGTPFAGQMQRFTTIGSTNTRALEQARLGAPHGSFYVADEQTAGRGRSNHHWYSAAGDGLYLSVLLRLPVSAQELVWMPLIAGLVTHHAIAQVTGLRPDLRWPNDILLGERKVAGILVEALHEPATSATRPVVLGVGVNMHQEQFPPDLATLATSLDLASGRRSSRQQLLIALLQSLHAELIPLGSAATRAAALAAIPGRIEAISSWIRGRAVDVHGPQACHGTTEGLDEKGLLRVRTADGLVTVTTGGLRAHQP